MSLVESFITNKIYSILYLDILLKLLWEKAVELWNIGGSAIPGAIVLILLMLAIAIFPLVAAGYGVYKLLKYYKIIE